MQQHIKISHLDLSEQQQDELRTFDDATEARAFLYEAVANAVGEDENIVISIHGSTFDSLTLTDFLHGTDKYFLKLGDGSRNKEVRIHAFEALQRQGWTIFGPEPQRAVTA